MSLPMIDPTTLTRPVYGDIETEIQGWPCRVDCDYSPGLPMRITGWGFGDCEPDEPDEFEITAVYDCTGKPWPELAEAMTDSDEERAYDDYMRYLRERDY